MSLEVTEFYSELNQVIDVGYTKIRDTIQKWFDYSRTDLLWSAKGVIILCRHMTNFFFLRLIRAPSYIL